MPNNINKNDSTKIPRHIAIIMDGNGRWAKKRLLPVIAGHRSGLKTAEIIIESAAKAGVKILTLFAFSSENWNRSEEEVQSLMHLFVRGLKKNVKKLHEKNIRLRFIGDRLKLKKTLQEKMAEAEVLTQKNDLFQLVVAVNYGGQWDIVQAAQKMVQTAAEHGITYDTITADFFEKALSTEALPAVDLLIRTSGEYRISNFLLWQIAYAELYFTEVPWPEFSEHHFQEALAEFSKRKRRFGGRRNF